MKAAQRFRALFLGLLLLALPLRAEVAVETITIAVDTATSTVLTLPSWVERVGFCLPATYDGTALTFTVSTAVDGTYVALFDDAGNAVGLTVAASRCISFSADQVNLLPWRYVKFVAGTTQTTTSTVITVTMKG